MATPGPFKMMVKNWKTSIVLVPSLGFGLWYSYDYTFTNSLMRTSCTRAAAYGDKKLRSPTSQTRHITVILNPAAGKGKSKKLYEKWVEPLLHLAGIKVSLVETRSLKEVNELMKIMSNCDGVAIVGGDGTVHEAINGLLHRPDRTKASKEFPIGIMPTGQYNTIARYLYQNDIGYRNQKEFLISTTSKLLDATMTEFDTLKITPLDEDLKNTQAPIYALRDIRYGLYQDNFFKISGFSLYQFYVRPVWQRLQRMFSSKYALPKIESLSYTEPCVGCKDCFERHRLHDDRPAEKKEEQSSNRKWWSVMAPVNRNKELSDAEKEELELSKRDNPECGLWINVSKTSDISDFRACMMGDKKVRMSIGKNREYSPSDITETQDIRLKLSTEIDERSKNETVSSSEEDKSENSPQQAKPADEDKKEKKGKPEPVQFLIDGQPSKAHSVEISAVHRAVTIFTGPYKMIVPD